MSGIKITPWLLEQIMRGNTVLFLGAGAIKGAKDNSGNEPVLASELRNILSDEFLGGELKDKSLSIVADYAKNLSSLRDVQTLVKNTFINFEPAKFHLKIPKFNWHSIFTTNYDFIIEKAYEVTTDRMQKLAPIISDSDHFSEKLADHQNVLYFKLHGCLSVIDNPKLPLILATEEYAKHKNNRKILFSHLKECAQLHPIIFCGYDINDPNISQILFDIGDNSINRPLYAIVKPGMTKLEEQYWSGRRFEVIDAKFEEFINHIDEQIPETNRKLASLVKIDSTSISNWLVVNRALSEELQIYLNTDLAHIHNGIASEKVIPFEFYRGLSKSWSIFDAELDVRRNITDEIISDSLDDGSRERYSQVYLLKGYAGSGKSITLRRAAWEAATQFDSLIFYLNEGGVIRFNLIKELYELTNQRITIFIDDVLDHQIEVQNLIKYAKANKFYINLIFGARTNEWNVYGEKLSAKLNEEYELRNLSKKEIELLLDKLKDNKCLGHLKELKKEERIAKFKFSAERQLLVLLHEATTGKTFEEIVYDEYLKIVPTEAKVLYLDICTLHRLGVGVRTGLISRISGITFENFNDKLHKPLEHVVRIIDDSRTRDYVYKSRHPLISKFVFQQALNRQKNRADQLIRILTYLNVDYVGDREAYNFIIKGRELAFLFANRRYADAIYNIAYDTGVSGSHINHQRAIFELNHPAGNLKNALKYIEDAERDADRSYDAIYHTKAMVLRRMASASKMDLQKEKIRNKSKKILSSKLKQNKDAYYYSGLGQILFDEIVETSEKLKNDKNKSSQLTLTEKVFTNQINDLEEIISDGLQQFPDVDILHSLRADLADVINDTPRALKALEHAFRINPMSEMIAIRLSQHYLDSDNKTEALFVLNKCLQENPGRLVRIHFHLAKIYINEDEEKNKETIVHHLKRSFTEGDINYESQILYARHQFIFGSNKEATRIFDRLGKQNFPPNFRNRTWFPILDDNGKNKKFSGLVINKTDNYCFVNVIGLAESIFIYFQQFSNNHWDQIIINDKIEFEISFTVRGPCGINAVKLP